MTSRVKSGTIHVHAYAQPLTVRAGENVSIMASAKGVGVVDAQLVRLLHGDEHPDGPGFVEEQIDHPANGPLSVTHQLVQRGNFAHRRSVGEPPPVGIVHALGLPLPDFAGRRAPIGVFLGFRHERRAPSRDR